jgi:predicted HTH transcriptional regulator
MSPAQLSALLTELLQQPAECEWLEFKHNNADPVMIGEYLSALANSAALHGRETAYLVWGIEDGTRRVVGTRFQPRRAKKGNEELENWLLRSLHPQVGFQMHEFSHQGQPIVLFEIPRAAQSPVRFGSEEFIRVGSLKKKLKDYPTKEADLWAKFARTPFETGIAKTNLAADEVLNHLDFVTCFDLLKIPLPSDRSAMLERLAEERMVVARPGGVFDLTNLGAILFAKNLSQFERLGRKALRIIKYTGPGRTESEREWHDPPSQKGYAVAFEAAVAFINSQLPQNEPIGQALRSETRMYPERAIRELLANALIHQDFSITGAGPMVEIFPRRLEITNPGEPLIDTLRFIDSPPRSRNEDLAAVMRRMGIAEERGTGIDKVIESIELFQLPAPDFTRPPGFTKVTVSAHQELIEMTSADRIRACYQHACLCHLIGVRMTNSTVRGRFAIDDTNAAQASRIIRETIAAGMIKLHDPEARRKKASYIPFWA